MKNTLIVTGGKTSKEFIKKIINNNKIDKIIAADKGLEILDKIKVSPDYIIGDFDSINKNILEKYEETEIIKLNPEKDFTDTDMALKLAIKLKSEEIYILGALGNRIDHVISNIHILKQSIDNNIKCKILDENNEIQLIHKGTYKVEKAGYKYISLIPLTTKAEGITLKGLKYPLNNATLRIGESLGISNEILENVAMIKVEKGILIMIKSND